MKHEIQSVRLWLSGDVGKTSIGPDGRLSSEFLNLRDHSRSTLTVSVAVVYVYSASAEKIDWLSRSSHVKCAIALKGAAYEGTKLDEVLAQGLPVRGRAIFLPTDSIGRFLLRRFQYDFPCVVDTMDSRLMTGSSVIYTSEIDGVL